MSELTFFRQKRFDGGVRTGVEFDGARLLRSFERGPGDLEDMPLGSGLEWYIDLRFSGPDLPKQTEAVKNWLLDQTEAIRHALSDYAALVGAGLDDEFPLESPPYKVGALDAQLRVVSSVTKRVTRLNFTEILTRFADEFPDYVRNLSTPEHVGV
jgi:hypothetical protein